MQPTCNHPFQPELVATNQKPCQTGEKEAYSPQALSAESKSLNSSPNYLLLLS
jgi:hypothetical protein